MQLGSPNFDAYARNLRRIYWMEFIDRQMLKSRPRAFRASIVAEPCEIIGVVRTSEKA